MVQIWRRRNNACCLADRTPAFEQDSQSVYWQLSLANRDNVVKKSLLIGADMEKKEGTQSVVQESLKNVKTGDSE